MCSSGAGARRAACKLLDAYPFASGMHMDTVERQSTRDDTQVLAKYAGLVPPPTNSKIILRRLWLPRLQGLRN
jgi:hypothetical protein